MKIKWKKDCILEIVENADEDTEQVETSEQEVKAGEIDEIDIFDQHDDVPCVDIQFGNGSIANGVPNNYFEVIE